MDYNQWAREMNVGAYYVKPTPKPSCHYFDSSVYANSKKHKLDIVKLFKKIIGIFM